MKEENRLAAIRRENLSKIENSHELQKDLAKKLSMSASQLGSLLAGYRNIGEKSARRIERALNMPENSLDSEYFTFVLGRAVLQLEPVSVYDQESKTNYDEIDVPVLIEAEEEGGIKLIREGEKMRFSRQFLLNEGVNPEAVRMVRMKDGSMMDQIAKDAMVYIDSEITEIEDGKIYAIEHLGELRIKQLYKHVGGGVRVKSRNAEYPDEIYDAEQARQIKIIGQAFRQSGNL